MFLNFGVLAAYGVILLFTNWPILSYYGILMVVLLAIVNIILYFTLNNAVEKNPEGVLQLTIFLNVLYVLFIVDYFGGPAGIFFPLLYLFIIGSFYFRKRWGFISLGICLTYLILHFFYFGNGSSDAFSFYLIPFGSLLVAGGGGWWFGLSIDKVREKYQSLDLVTDKLTSEKSQDEAVLAAIADGVYAVDMDRNLVLINKAAQEMTSWSEKDALGLKCSSVMKLKNEGDISVCEKDCPALAVWDTGEAVFRNDTCFFHKKTRKRIQLSSSYSPIKDFEGKMAGAICVFRDVTKEREVERLRNEFVSTASHELRTPITATEGYLSNVTDSGMVKIDDKGREFIAKAKNTLMNMSKLIQNLLAVTKIEEGKLETNVINFSIHDLTKEVADVFEPRAKEKGIGLTLLESKNLNVKGKKVIGRSLNVRADMEMIREVMNNLIENAIKFTDKGGVTVSIDYDEEFATVNVEDTGIGMSADAQKHLFEKFYRIDNSATREIGGTGLGLFITRSIVETSGGRIWVESTQDKGSKFHFTVPLSLD